MHEPTKECLGYAALRELPKDTDQELCALLAKLSVVQVVLVETIL
jgi:hypothetical protein